MNDRRHHKALRGVLRRTFGLKQPILGAEIGVHRGDLSAGLLHAFPRLTLLMVDPWLCYQSRVRRHTVPVLDTQRQRLDDYQTAYRAVQWAVGRGVIWRATSLEVAACLQDRSLHFAFIDAAHDETSVAADIRAWWPKIQVGGFLAGHDYGRRNCPGVATAVHAWCEATGGTMGVDVQVGHGTMWYTSPKIEE